MRMYDGLLVIDADAHKMENPVVFFDYLDAPYRDRLASRTDRYGQPRLVVRDRDPRTGAEPARAAPGGARRLPDDPAAEAPEPSGLPAPARRGRRARRRPRRARLTRRLPALGGRRAGRHLHPLPHLRPPEPDADGARGVRVRRRLRPLSDAPHGLPGGRLWLAPGPRARVPRALGEAHPGLPPRYPHLVHGVHARAGARAPRGRRATPPARQGARGVRPARPRRARAARRRTLRLPLRVPRPLARPDRLLPPRANLRELRVRRPGARVPARGARGDGRGCGLLQRRLRPLGRGPHRQRAQPRPASGARAGAPREAPCRQLSPLLRAPARGGPQAARGLRPQPAGVSSSTRNVRSGPLPNHEAIHAIQYLRASRSRTCASPVRSVIVVRRPRTRSEPRSSSTSGFFCALRTQSRRAFSVAT